jgi:hypothetical protein
MSRVRWQPSQRKCNEPSREVGKTLLAGASVSDSSGGSHRYGSAT